MLKTTRLFLESVHLNGKSLKVARYQSEIFTCGHKKRLLLLLENPN